MTEPEERLPRQRFTVVGLGELLWDLLPTGRQLGGAPANFAYHVARLGDHGIIASRVGPDELGRLALTLLASRGLTTRWIQRDPERPTGTVPVTTSATGEPTYTITRDVAWDELAWSDDWQTLAEGCAAVCFGSLAQRSLAARRTIEHFLAAAPPTALRIFDVNLRQSFYSAELLDRSFRAATIAKLNHSELPLVCDLLDLTTSTEPLAQAQALLGAYDLQLVCLTRGAAGSLLLSTNDVDEHPGVPVDVVNTIGAGDAFTAAVVYHLLRGAPLPLLNQAANQLGAWVAGQAGAMPD